MGKITKEMQARHRETLSPAIDAFAKRAAAASLASLPDVLSTFPTKWPFPRGDLYHWVPALNRFDNVLERFCAVYKLDQGPQTCDFGTILLRGEDEGTEYCGEPLSMEDLREKMFGDNGDETLIRSILKFTRMLINKCGNRSMYASSAHLNHLLNSTSLGVVLDTLQIGSELAQRYQASVRKVGSTSKQSPLNQTLLANHYNIEVDRVLHLSRSFSTTPIARNSENASKGKDKDKAGPVPSTKNQQVVYANDLVAFATSEDNSKWSSWGDVKITYYPVAPLKQEETAAADNQSSGTVPLAPTPLRRSTTLQSTASSSASVSSRAGRAADDNAATNARQNSGNNAAGTDESAASSSRTKSLQIPHSAVAQSSIYDLVARIPQDAPEPIRYEMLHRIRVAKAVVSGTLSRQMILAIRLAAITNLTYLYDESTFVDLILKQDNEETRRLQLVYQLTELVHPPAHGSAGVPLWLQTIVFLLLNPLVGTDARAADIASAMNANVGHGVLLYIVRKAVASINDEESGVGEQLTELYEWRHAILCFTNELATNGRSGVDAISAGIVEVAIDVLKLRTVAALRHYATLVGLLDTLVWQYPAGFQSFLQAHGLDAVADLFVYSANNAIEFVEADLGTHTEMQSLTIDYRIPFYHQQTLKWLLKLLHHSMVNSYSVPGQNSERLLRNLADKSDLLRMMKQIIEQIQLYGSVVWTNSVNILADFINHDPPSFATISESGMIKSFLEVVTGNPVEDEHGNQKLEENSNSDGDDLLTPIQDSRPHPPTVEMLVSGRPDDYRPASRIVPSVEAISIIPYAFNSICLNPAGLKMVAHSGALGSFFEIFESPRHVKILSSDRTTVPMLGQQIDELARHHPALRDHIRNAVLDMVARIGHLAKQKHHQEGWGVGFKVMTADGKVVSSNEPKAKVSPQQPAKDDAEDVAMPEVAEGDSAVATSSAAVPKQPEPVEMEDVLPFIHVLAKFLDNYLVGGHKEAFLRSGGFELILDLAMSPSLPTHFVDSSASRPLSAVITGLVEGFPSICLPSLLKRTRAVFGKILSNLNTSENGSFFSRLIEEEAPGNDGQALLSDGAELDKLTDTARAFLQAQFLITAVPMCIQTSSRSSHILMPANIWDYHIDLIECVGPLVAAIAGELTAVVAQVPAHWCNFVREPLDPTTDRERDPSTASSEAVHRLFAQWIASTSSSSPNNNAEGAATSSTTDMPPHRPSKTEMASARYKNFATIRYLVQPLVPKIHPYLSAMGRCLMTRRERDKYLLGTHLTMARAIAKTLVSTLDTPAESQSPWVWNSWVMGINIVYHSLIQTGPPSSRSASTTGGLYIMLPNALTFMEEGGMASLNRLLDIFQQELCQRRPLDMSAEHVARRACASEGMRRILEIYSALSHHSPIQDAIGSYNIRTEQRRDQLPAPLLTVQFRHAMMPAVMRLWTSPLFEQESEGLSLDVILDRTLQILNQIGQAASEPTETSILMLAPFKLGQLKLDDRKFTWAIQQYKEYIALGFDRDLVCEALYRNYASVGASPMTASNYLDIMKAGLGGGRNPVPEKEPLPEVPEDVEEEEQKDTSGGDELVVGSLDRDEEMPDVSAVVNTAADTVADAAADAAANTAADTVADTAADTVADAAADTATDTVANAAADTAAVDSNTENTDNATTAGEADNNNTNEAADNNTDAAADNGNNGEPFQSEAEANTAEEPAAVEEEGTIEMLKTELDQMRQMMRNEMIDRCLDVVRTHPHVAIEVGGLIVATVFKAESDDGDSREDVGQTLTNALESLGTNYDERKDNASSIAAYSHLFALLLQDGAFFRACTPTLRGNIEDYISFLSLSPSSSQEALPAWIPYILLVIELVIAHDEQPVVSAWRPPSNEDEPIDQPVLELVEQILSDEHREKLVDCVLDLLPRVGKDNMLATSVLRVMVILCRRRALAKRFGEKKNLQRLFVMVKQMSATGADGIQTTRLMSSLMSILRSIVEDEEIVRQIMRSEIKSHMVLSRNRSIDLSNYMRGLGSLALRDPALFVEVTNEMIRLQRWQAGYEGRHSNTVELKPDETADAAADPAAADATEPASETAAAPSEGETTTTPAVAPEAPEAPPAVPSSATGPDAKDPTSPHVKESTEDKEMADVSRELKWPVVENPDGVIHFLLCELLNYREIDDKEPQSLTEPAATTAEPEASSVLGGGTDTPSTPPPEANDATLVPVPAAATTTASAAGGAADDSTADKDKKKSSNKHPFKSEEHPIFVYRCLLLSCLSELLGSYNRAKIEFINFKRSAPTQASTPIKPRSGVMQYLINDFVCCGPPSDGVGYKKKKAISLHAQRLLVALVAKTGEVMPEKPLSKFEYDEEDSDLLFVRTFMLDTLLRSYEKASSFDDPAEMRYSRMASLAKLMDSMITEKDMKVHSRAGGAGLAMRAHLHVRRLMYEKGYIEKLTASIAEADLGFPDVKQAIDNVLVVLRRLTQTAKELSHHNIIPVASLPDAGDDDDLASHSSVSDMHSDREDTPDLYRNSTLGMLEPADNEGDDDDDSDDGEEDDEMYDDWPEYDEEGSADAEENVSDDDEMDGMAQHMHGDHHMHDVAIHPGPVGSMSPPPLHEDEDDDDMEIDSDMDGEHDDDDEDDEDDDDDDRLEIEEDDGEDMLDDGDGAWENVIEDEHDDPDQDEDEDDEEDYGDDGDDGDEGDDDAPDQHVPILENNHFGAVVEEVTQQLAFARHVTRADDIDILQHMADALGGHAASPPEYEFEHDHDNEDEEEDEDEDHGEHDEDEQEDYVDFEVPFGGERDGRRDNQRIYGWDPREAVSPPSGLMHFHHHFAHHHHVAPPGAPGDRHQFFMPVRNGGWGGRGDGADNNRYYFHNIFGGPVDHGPIPPDEGINPLLRRRTTLRGGSSRAPTGPQPPAVVSLRVSGNLGLADSRFQLQFLESLMDVLPLMNANDNIHLEVPGHGSRRLHNSMLSSRHVHTRRDGHFAEPTDAVDFTAHSTRERYEEAARLAFGQHMMDAVMRLHNVVHARLIPAAIEANKKRRAEEAELQKKLEEYREQEKRDAEIRRAEDVEREKREAEAREEREMAEQAAAAAEAAEAAERAEAEMSRAASGPENETAGDSAAEPMEGVEAPKTPEAGGEETAEGSGGDNAAPAPEEPPRNRVVTMIRGTEVDVTDLGIDADYLDALPEEFREEVIAQAVSTRRSEARQQASNNGNQDNDFQVFLNALPEPIRREVIQQERQEERRRQQEEQRRLQPGAVAPNQGPAFAADMDAASILLTFSPMLREQILLEQGSELIDHLPPNSEMMAQARRAQERHDQQQAQQQQADSRGDSMFGRPSGQPSTATALGVVRPGAAAAPTDDKAQRRTVIQMFDKSGIATLLRLMFMSQQPDMRQSLFNVFENVCENRQNRLEVISTLVQILQDGSTDMETIERTYGQISLRAKKIKDASKDGAELKTPVLKRTHTDLASAAAASGSSSLLQLNSDVSPLLIITQCLDLLVDLCATNPHVSWMFLTEHDISNLSLKRAAGKKGKGKDSKAHRFAINALLSLLERDTVMESFGVMAHLAELLYKVTVPLQTMERRRKEAEEEAASEAKKKLEEKEKEEDKEKEEGKEKEGDKEKEEQGQEESGNGQGQASSSSAAAATTTTTTPAAGPSSANDTTTTAPTDADDKDKEKEPETTTTGEVKAKKSSKMIPPPPVIPASYLNLVVRIFVARECPSKTFQNTISTIKNLSTIPGAKAVIGDELVRQALLLSAKIVVDLEQLLPHINNAKSGTELQGVALNKFSPNASDQNKLLRVLTALDHLFEPKKKLADEQGKEDNNNTGKENNAAKDDAGREDTVAAETEKQDLVASLYDNPAFGDMWTKLSACLVAIRQQENMINVATILLPLIESLMVVCKSGVVTEQEQQQQQQSPLGESQKEGERVRSSPQPDSRMAGLFFTFTGDNRRILNELVRNNPKLMSGTFALLVKNPNVLEFDNKRNYFNRNVRARGASHSHHRSSGTLNVNVGRDTVFLDSFKKLFFRRPDEVKYGKLNIKFNGEEGVDAGGVTREWFQALSRDMFNPDWGLFTPVSSDRTTFHPSTFSAVNPEHLDYFKFIGRIIAKALYEGRLLDCHFSRAVYKRILGKSVSVKDVESFDPEYYKSLIWMLENDITDIITETFSVEEEVFGVVNTHDLVENGREIAVTEENKHEYVRLIVEHKLLTSVQDQMREFLKGFHEIIPKDLISIFGEQELELLISGLPDIDVDDWRANTEYQNYSPSSPQIQWFWRALRSFDKEELAKLLQFVTGTSKVPLNGFKDLEGMNGVNRFNIHRDYGNKERLPSSHTCFNQLDLPEYENYDELRSQLLKAITAGSEYFGFA